MDTAPPEVRILATLKRELRAKGLHYSDVAARLRVSEATIKRYFNGKGVSLSVLVKLADIAGLDLLALAELAERDEIAGRTFSEIQQQALTESHLLSAIYFLLWKGWTPERIAYEFELENELDAPIAELQRLGLIRRLSHSIKILATPNMEQKGGNQLAELTRVNAHLFISELDLADPRSLWSASSARLSVVSATRLGEMIIRFLDEAAMLMSNDMKLPREQVKWYRLFAGAQPITRSRFMRPQHHVGR